ncbi:MAG: hypothetical protein CYPHOPRED_004213, partial [Cyphobasidiales sp. Tagirdzhanova-0007]
MKATSGYQGVDPGILPFERRHHSPQFLPYTPPIESSRTPLGDPSRSLSRSLSRSPSALEEIEELYDLDVSPLA